MPIDYNKYPPNWKTEIRPRILERANNCCEFCGIENYSEGWYDIEDNWNNLPTDENEAEAIRNMAPEFETKVIKIVLTIAHLDHDEENHDVKDERLAALCQRCHLRYDAPEKARRRRVKRYRNTLFPIK